MTTAKDLIQEWKQLDQEAEPWKERWEESLLFCKPEERTTRQGQVDGGRRDGPVETTAVISAGRLASGLFSNTVAFGQEWFTLRASDPEIADTDAVRRYLNATADISLKAIQNSNFAQALAETLYSFGVVGTSPLYIEMLPNHRLSFVEYPIQECRIAQGRDGRVDTLFRQFQMTAAQAEERWGEKLPSDIRAAAGDPQRRHGKHWFIHAVKPRPPKTRNAKVGGKLNMPFASFWIAKKEEHLLEEGGYLTFPFAVPRFYQSADEVYGRSPAMRAMPSILTANQLLEDHLYAGEMAANPAIFRERRGDATNTRLEPGVENYLEPGEPPPTPYVVNPDAMAYTASLLVQQQEAIERHFFVDLFQMFDNEKRQNITATEVNERSAERIQAITPVVSRMQSELYSVLIERVVSLVIEADMAPEPPAELEGAGYEINYTTRLDSKLAATEVQNLRSTISIMGELAEQLSNFPEDLRPLFDAETICRFVANALNVAPELVLDETKAKAVKRAQDAARAAAAEQEALSQGVRPVDPQKAPEAGSPIDMLRREQQQMGVA